MVRRIDALRVAFKPIKSAYSIDINAIVVLSGHLDCLWALPKNDADYSARWSLIKPVGWGEAFLQIPRIMQHRLGGACW